MNARDGGIAALVDSCNVRRKSGLSHHVKHCVVAFLRRKHASSARTVSSENGTT